MNAFFDFKPRNCHCFSPLCLFICFESNVNSLGFGIFARNSVTFFNISILLQQRLYIAKMRVLRNPADDHLRRLTTQDRDERGFLVIRVMGKYLKVTIEV